MSHMNESRRVAVSLLSQSASAILAGAFAKEIQLQTRHYNTPDVKTWCGNDSWFILDNNKRCTSELSLFPTEHITDYDVNDP